MRQLKQFTVALYLLLFKAELSLHQTFLNLHLSLCSLDLTVHEPFADVCFFIHVSVRACLADSSVYESSGMLIS